MRWQWINYQGYRLRAPEGFLEWEAENNCGCGPGKLGDRLVPDSNLGISILPACCVHDYAYSIGQTEEERTNADIELFANAFRILKQQSSKTMLFFRSVILGLYFMACVYGGKEAFN